MAKGKITKLHVGITVLIIVKIAIIISLVYLAFSIASLKQDIANQINETQTELSAEILNNQQLTQSQINELRDNLMATQKDINEEISEIKATSGDDISGIVSEAIKSVVSVGTDVSQGSGFIIDDEGYIVTNAHVLSGAHYARILTYESDNWVSAQLIGYNENMDVAILKITGNYDSLEFADSDNVKIGEKAIALGNPLGLSFSVSQGIVSAVNREGPNGLDVYLQIDTPLNAGNSGGPLINSEGDVIGINNFKISGGENLGFALESNSAADAINDIFEAVNQSVRV